MSENSSIEWTDHTFNPWWGCAKVSPGCDNCYAERDAHRYQPATVLWGLRRDGAERRTFGDKHWAEPIKWNAKARREGKRMRVFCASMADVFDKDGDHTARTRLWMTIRGTPALDWLILTKRIGNAKALVPEDWGDGYPNVWLGISVVNQEEADRDIPKLDATPARIRFLSIEPMLGPIDIGWERLWGTGSSNGIDWVICGGESGPHARPMHPDWARSLRNQCAEAGVPFLFKQWGEHSPGELAEHPDYPGEGSAWRLDQTGRRWHDAMESTRPRGEWAPIKFARPGKKLAGRLLDGVQHDGFPA